MYGGESRVTARTYVGRNRVEIYCVCIIICKRLLTLGPCGIRIYFVLSRNAGGHVPGDAPA